MSGSALLGFFLPLIDVQIHSISTLKSHHYVKLYQFVSSPRTPDGAFRAGYRDYHSSQPREPPREARRETEDTSALLALVFSFLSFALFSFSGLLLFAFELAFSLLSPVHVLFVRESSPARELIVEVTT